jgi:hypothetical protein
MPRMRAVLASALVTVALVALACSKKPRECTALIDTIDDDDKPVAQLLATGATLENVRDIGDSARSLAVLEDKMRGDLGALKLTDVDVIGLEKQYGEFAEAAAGAARDTAVVMAEVAAYQPTVDPANAGSVPQKMRAAADAMHARCVAKKSNECVALFDQMKSILAAADKATSWSESATAIDAFVAKLGALTLKDTQLQADVTAFAATMKESAASLREAVVLQTKMGGAKEKLDSVLALERTVTTRVNDVCVPQRVKESQTAADGSAR